jgi:hypothetical protein
LPYNCGRRGLPSVWLEVLKNYCHSLSKPDPTTRSH